MQQALLPLERELLQACADFAHGEPTRLLDETLIAASPGRRALEAALRNLVERGLMVTERGTYGGPIRGPEGEEVHGVYDDDWWIVTAAGRAAIGLPPRRPSPAG